MPLLQLRLRLRLRLLVRRCSALPLLATVAAMLVPQPAYGYMGVAGACSVMV